MPCQIQCNNPHGCKSCNIDPICPKCFGDCKIVNESEAVCKHCGNIVKI